MTHLDLSRSAHASAARRDGPGLLQRLALWRQRRQLAALDDRALADIGISRTQARREAQRAVWDVPANWRG